MKQAAKTRTLTFNGLQFAEIKKLPVQAPTGLHGFFRASSNGVHLYKPDGALEAYIVNNPRQGRFVVSASLFEGRPRYMFSTSSLTERWLKIEGMGLSAEDDVIKKMTIQ